MWCSVCRASTTRSIPRRVRSFCARCAGAASSGSYTISVELKNGKTEAFTLTVSDSAPTGESWAVEEYNTFSPSEPKFTLPLTRTSVRTVTVQNSGVTEALNAAAITRSAVRR